jgi:hypothetical protein
VYATVTSDALDDKKLELFRLEDVMPPDETRHLRGRQIHDFVDASQDLAIDDDHCSLQEGCGSFDVIDVAIVVDSSLCAYAGGSSDVNTLSQRIVATTSQFYKVPGLCKKLEISYLDIHCDPDTDPIRPYLSQAGTDNVCGSGGLLQFFVGYVSSTGINSDVAHLFHGKYFTGYVSSTGLNSDVAHLFHGKDFTGTSTVRCANIGSICNTDGYNTGVKEMSFSDSPSTQSKLVGHENGHMRGGIHVSDSTDVMYPTIGGSHNHASGQSSKDSNNSKVDSTSCTSVENVPTLSPVSSPMTSPIPVPTVTPTPPAPTGSPIEAPTPAPTDAISKDDSSFRFQWKSSEEDCKFLAGMSKGQISEVCREMPAARRAETVLDHRGGGCQETRSESIMMNEDRRTYQDTSK